jgi:hypothetical protein
VSSVLENNNIDPCSKTLTQTFKKGSEKVKKYSCAIKNVTSDQIKNLNSLAKNTSEKIPDIIKKIEESTLGNDITDPAKATAFISTVLADKEKCEQLKIGLGLSNQLNDAVKCIGENRFTNMTLPNCPSSFFLFGMENIGSLQQNIKAAGTLKEEIKSLTMLQK